MTRAGLTALLFMLTAMTWATRGLGHATPTEQDRLQGTWQIVSVSRSGESDELQVGGFVTFAGDSVVFGPSPASADAQQARDTALAAFS